MIIIMKSFLYPIPSCFFMADIDMHEVFVLPDAAAFRQKSFCIGSHFRRGHPFYHNVGGDPHQMGGFFGTADFFVVAFGAECRLNGIPTAAAADLGKEKTLNMIAQTEEIILLAPSLKVISDLAQGRDDSLMEYLFLHAALWGKTTEIWMDFEAPQSRRLLPASPIADHVDALKNLGVKWFCYRKKQENKQEEKRILLTEEDVLQAYKAGNAEMVLEKGTMVTPLAKDATRRLGVKLKVQEVK